MKERSLYAAEAVAPEIRRENLDTSDEISVIHWLRPAERVPEESSYILIKMDLGEDGLFCLEGAYENGRYWDLFPENFPLEEETILGWAYPPFDTRLS